MPLDRFIEIHQVRIIPRREGTIQLPDPPVPQAGRHLDRFPPHDLFPVLPLIGFRRIVHTHVRLHALHHHMIGRDLQRRLLPRDHPLDAIRRR